MNPDADPLAELRDVILPPDPSFWPPAIGWWLLAVLAVVLAVSALYGIRYFSARLARTSVVNKVSNLKQLDSKTAVVELSILLKKIAVTKYPRAQVAGLTGSSWLEFLDQSGDTDQFTRGPGRILATAPYSKQIAEDLNPLFDLCENWVRKIMSEC